ncbi:MAG: phosphoenolpyruvate-protein phosphotransferase PtsP, partial [Candidatus Sumerlaeia bacterium]|nr:phosphoenolpyruvate-protein phosphotransferase PtsP [Candidatus Sumerlaeia bacterium]
AVLQLISHVAQVSQRTNTPLSVCGEMASGPHLALLLIGLGVDTLSMSPGMIGPVKQAIRSSRYEDLQAMAKHALTLSTASEVLAVLSRDLGPLGLSMSGLHHLPLQNQ